MSHDTQNAYEKLVSTSTSVENKRRLGVRTSKFKFLLYIFTLVLLGVCGGGSLNLKLPNCVLRRPGITVNSWTNLDILKVDTVKFYS